jgi:L,D-peptidoglycan transpeptidase YkuD (ErfK/YbiS/YcfS/YnhG family)|tara:strand:- start:83 stop:574 length:492 start_codon:yes stop_codon:yes gene_type:complete
MLIYLKDKDTLVVDDFYFKCAIGKNGVTKNKVERDMRTPSGTFELGPLYYRKDKVPRPTTKFKLNVIKKNMGWCDDPKSKFYNNEIIINKLVNHEKLFRKDSNYDYILVIGYNTKKKIPYKGSAIFIHLTKNYKPTAGCISLKKKDFLILIKLINKKTKIKIY